MVRVRRSGFLVDESLIREEDHSDVDAPAHHSGGSSTQRELVSQVPKFGARHTFAVLAFFGLLNVCAMRTVLSVGIVAMVNSTAINERKNGSDPVYRAVLGPSPFVIASGLQPSANNYTICVSGLEPALSTNDTDDGGSLDDGPFVWDEEAQGLVLGSFFYGYVVAQIPAGHLASKWGGKRLLGVGILATAIFNGLVPLASKTAFGLLIVVRILQGLCEGVAFPAMASMIAEWAPPSERSRMSSFVSTGTTVGRIVSLSTSGAICEKLGWEWLFYIFSSVSVIWFVCWCCLVYDSPGRHPRITVAERDLIEVSLGKRSAFSCDEAALPDRDKGSSSGVPWRSILSSRPVWGLLVVSVCQAFAGYLLVAEVPSYMKKILRYDMNKDALLSALPYLVECPVSLISGPIADGILSNGLLSTTSTRKLFSALSTWIPGAALVSLGFAGCNGTHTMLLLCAATGLYGLAAAGTGVNPIDISPNFSGAVVGIVGFCSGLMGFAAPAIVGVIGPHNDGWRITFALGGSVLIIGNVAFLLLGSGQVQHWNSTRNASSAVSPQGPLVSEDEIVDAQPVY